MQPKFNCSTFLIAVLACAMSTGCNRDDDSIQQVPNVPVEITVSIGLPLFAPLQNPGGWITIQGGSQGIVVYRIGPDQFAAFDRHCTFRVENQCRIDVDEDTNVTAVDHDCCESVFSIVDGVPLEGPARRPLRRYQTMYNVNNNSLRIYN